MPSQPSDKSALPADQSSPAAVPNPDPSSDPNSDPKRDPPSAEKLESDSSKIKPLTSEQQEELLVTRLRGGMGYTFRQFSNMFLVSSRLQIGTGIGLVTSDRGIGESTLSSPFPEAYRPTLREFLDAIALQTFSQWTYDPSSKYFRSEVKHDAPVEGLAMFEFSKRVGVRLKPFAVTIADGWTSEDKGNWVMLIPPTFPVGMDIYEMGTYSSEETDATADFTDKIRAAIAMEWAQRVNENAQPKDIQPAKVGSYDALFYESMVPSHLGKEMKWRHWVLMVGNKCYFIVSTILPDYEDKIFPDVQKMIATFHITDAP